MSNWEKKVDVVTISVAVVAIVIPIFSQEIRCFLKLPRQNCQPSRRSEMIEHIKSGNEFKVIFDRTKGKFNDDGWQGRTNDPMGTLKAGRTYTVTYSRSEEKYQTCGLNEYQKEQHGKEYYCSRSGGANPDEAKISLWGRLYEFDAERKVYDFEQKYGHIGTLELVYRPNLMLPITFFFILCVFWVVLRKIGSEVN